MQSAHYERKSHIENKMPRLEPDPVQVPLSHRTIEFVKNCPGLEPPSTDAQKPGCISVSQFSMSTRNGAAGRVYIWVANSVRVRLTSPLAAARHHLLRNLLRCDRTDGTFTTCPYLPCATPPANGTHCAINTTV